MANPTIPLCLTELGYLSPEGLPEALDPAFTWANEASVEEQAQSLIDSISTFNHKPRRDGSAIRRISDVEL